METYCFIGSDKNSGKTTAFNFIYGKICKQMKNSAVCITSIGINGENIDQYEGSVKPRILIRKKSFFITLDTHLKGHTGKYEMIEVFKIPDFTQTYILGRCRVAFETLLEGPNTGPELIRLKCRVASILSGESYLLIDGSIDRQFIANPIISDRVYVSVLFSKSRPLKKTTAFLDAITLAGCNHEIAQVIGNEKRDKTKTLLLDEADRIIYHGEQAPFCDKNLCLHCMERTGVKTTLYLNGALTKSLYGFLAPLGNLTLVLDNFTYYQGACVLPGKAITFRPLIQVLAPVKVGKIFVKQEMDYSGQLLAQDLPAVNLFRGDPHEIGI